MRTLKIGSHTLPVMYAGVNTYSDTLKTQIYFGEMGLVKLARILDGKAAIEYHDGDAVTTFEGYTMLREIRYVDDETIVAVIRKGVLS